MSKFARIENSTAVEVFTVPDGFTLADCFHTDIAAQFSPCPANVTQGSTVDAAGEWTIAPEPSPSPAPAEAPEVVPPKVSPIEFKLLFAAQERVAIKESTDPIVMDFFSIVEDPRLTAVDLALQSTQDALSYLVALTLITATRKSEILTGVLK